MDRALHGILSGPLGPRNRPHLRRLAIEFVKSGCLSFCPEIQFFYVVMGKPDSTMMVMVGSAWVPQADEARAVGTIYRIKKRPRIFVAKIPAKCLSAVDLK